MLSFLKKIFGSKPAETPVPYKVEVPVAKPEAEKKTADKKPAAKKTTRKPKASK
jgi:hypothetical protein